MLPLVLFRWGLALARKFGRLIWRKKIASRLKVNIAASLRIAGFRMISLVNPGCWIVWPFFSAFSLSLLSIHRFFLLACMPVTFAFQGLDAFLLLFFIFLSRSAGMCETGGPSR
ncbi:hypothetical protein HOY82DRAFT_68206 [Tuber indicum]|nr:hypothetical protein HOY82DRAFT_68206 [Tuber indicum]